jgi:hypothetical protein
LAALTAGFALVTYIGAYAWERYLRRLHLAPEEWEHHAIAAFPHLAATTVLGTLLVRGLDPVHLPAALALLGAGLLFVGVLTHLNGIKASGIAAVALAAYYFQAGLYADEASIAQHSAYPVYFAALIFGLIASERLVVLLQHYESFPSLIEDALRSALVFLCTVLGLLGLAVWNPPNALALHAGGTLGFALMGALFRDRRYLWAALGVACATAYTAGNRFTLLTHIQQITATGIAVLVLVVLALAFTHFRRAPGECAPHGERRDG